MSELHEALRAFIKVSLRAYNLTEAEAESHMQKTMFYADGDWTDYLNTMTELIEFKLTERKNVN